MNVTKHTSLFLGIVLLYLNINGSGVTTFWKAKAKCMSPLYGCIAVCITESQTNRFFFFNVLAKPPNKCHFLGYWLFDWLTERKKKLLVFSKYALSQSKMRVKTIIQFQNNYISNKCYLKFHSMHKILSSTTGFNINVNKNNNKCIEWFLKIMWNRRLK